MTQDEGEENVAQRERKYVPVPDAGAPSGSKTSKPEVNCLKGRFHAKPLGGVNEC
jgi:hypothetical protein